MKFQPLVSVLIPTYNVSAFIEEAVASIVSQTYKNLEIIIVDDCSTDGTYEMLVNFQKSDNRIKLFRNDKNLRIAATLNFALSVCKGEYIARMDGDDISVPERIEKQVKFMQEHPDIDLVGLHVINIDEGGAEIKRPKFCTSAETCRELVKYSIPVYHFWLAKKEAYEKVGNYRISTVEDYDFLLRMATLKLKFCNHPEYLYKQRIRIGNTATSSGLIQRKYLDYVRQLYNERVNNVKSEDSFSEEEVIRLRHANKIESMLFNISIGFTYKFGKYNHQNKIKAAIYFFLALVFSPIRQSKYYICKAKYNRILNSGY